MTESTAFKSYFNRDAANELAARVKGAYAAFDEARFVEEATVGLEALEMTDRVKQFSASLRVGLPADIEEALAVLTKSLPDKIDGEPISNGFLLWPFGQFVADYGVDFFDASMDHMVELTQRFTSEFAVRPFLDRYPERTFERFYSLATHESEHVRRWCSEGSRPRLPWGARIKSLVHDPAPIVPILEALRDDPSLYVRKSVANNLNDIAKDHPARVVALCRAWWKDGSDERRWVVRHALRTLIKSGDPAALGVLGFGSKTAVEAELHASPKRLRIGERASLAAVLRNPTDEPEALVVDYIVHFIKSNGKASAKVFKWKNVELAPHAQVVLEKRHPFHVTTVRPLYEGVHRIELQVNGRVLAEARMTLVQPPPPRGRRR